MHHHNENCNCGEHSHHCDSLSQPHVHDENCGCGHAHTPIPTPDGLSPLQMDFLVALRQRQCLPVACFSYAKTGDSERYGVALAPVYISAPSDSMERVKQLGNELSQLEEIGLLTLDYDIPLQNYSYEEYQTSALYAYFVKTVAQAATLPDPTFDTPTLELGSIALTEAGEKMVDDLLR